MPRTAVEYATDNITVYRGLCPYRCVYCWAWRIPIFRYRILKGKYDPVDEAKRYLNLSNRVIVVSFTSDPYPPKERRLRLTRRVLEALSVNRSNKVMVLTKNPKLAIDLDLDLFTKNKHFWLGTTITTLIDEEARAIEPLAPSPWDRIDALRYADRNNVRTWLSIEPIIPFVTFPEDVIYRTISYVDYYVLGAFNYYNRITLPHVNRYINYRKLTKRELTTWYNIHIPKAIELLRKHGKPFFIKKELRKYLSPDFSCLPSCSNQVISYQGGGS